ncbi:MAG: tetratricopeptide repeat protein [Planctomycetes bacterium]|nr:tetratricopeptide repeat protein [Planctomycetota bacterium]
MRLGLTFSVLLLLLLAPGGGLDAGQESQRRLDAVRRQQTAWSTVLNSPKSETMFSELLASQATLSLTSLSADSELPTDWKGELAEEIAYEQAWLESLRDEARIGRIRRRAKQQLRPKTHDATLSKVSSAALTSRALSAPPHAPQVTPRVLRPETSTKAEPPLLGLNPLSDPIDLGDAYYESGQFRAALAQYGIAATLSGIKTKELARARFGLARSLERLGRVGGALTAYESVAELPDAEPWASAAAFGQRFIAWKRRLDQVRGASGVPRKAE